MKKINIKNLALITIMTPCVFFWGNFLENIYEPFAGAIIFTVVYLLALCGRAPRTFRAIACFVMSWGLFFFAEHLNTEMTEFHAPLLECDADIPFVEAKLVFGHKTQAVISVITAILAYFVGRRKFVTMDN